MLHQSWHHQIKTFSDKICTDLYLAVLIISTEFSNGLCKKRQRDCVTKVTQILLKQYKCLDNNILYFSLWIMFIQMLPVVRQKHIFLGSPSEPHLHLNSVSLSEVSVWILGAPYFHNLSSHICVFIYNLKGYCAPFQTVRVM